MMTRLICLSALCVAAVSLLAIGAQAAPTCDFAGFDLSELAGRVLTGSDGSQQYNYHVAVCAFLPNDTNLLPCTQEEPQASACQISNQIGANGYVTGVWDGSAQWSLIDPSNKAKGVQYQMTGMQSCWVSGAASSYMTNVQFVCAASLQNPTVTVSGCTQTYTIGTPLACYNPPTSCGGVIGNDVYDFTSLSNQTLTYSGITYGYSLELCGPLPLGNACSRSADDASACQTKRGGAEGAWAAGIWRGSPAWSFIDSKQPSLGVQYTLWGENTCFASGSAQPYQANIQLVCARSFVPLKVDTNWCMQTYTIGTPLACPTTSRGANDYVALF